MSVVSPQNERASSEVCHSALFFKGGKLGVGMLLQRGKRGIVIHGGAWLANNEQDTDDSSRFWCDPTTRCYGAAH